MKMEDVVFTYVGGLKTACLGRKQLVMLIDAKIQDYRTRTDSLTPLVIFDSNGQGISIANSDPTFKRLLDDADIVHADGQSVVLFSRWFSNVKIPERTATTDTIHDIPLLSPRQTRHFLLGGTQAVVERCGDILQNRYNNFLVADSHHGYFDEDYETIIVESINVSKPDVLWVGLGKPKEQEFVIRNKSRLNVPVIITCGGCYNYITGDYKRAPALMQRTGFEWLHRAASEPKKFLWRYVTTNPHSIYCAWKHRNKSRV